MNFRLLTSLVALFVIPIAASAQTGTLTGSIRDGESGEGLFAANVLITSLSNPATKVGQLTDGTGNFSIELPAGRYEVRASYVGYETGVVDVVDVPDDGTASIMLDLVVEPIEMNKIVVSASRKEERVLDAPASVQVVEEEEIRDTTVLTPADHLQGRAGVDVQRAGVNQGTVVIRGFNNIFSGATLTLG